MTEPILTQQVLDDVERVLQDYYKKKIPFVLVAEVHPYLSVGTNLADDKGIEMLRFATEKVNQKPS